MLCWPLLKVHFAGHAHVKLVLDIGMWVTELGMWVTDYELSTRSVGNLQSKNCTLDLDIYLKMSVDLGNLPKKLSGCQVFFRILIYFHEKIIVFSVTDWPQFIIISGS